MSANARDLAGGVGIESRGKLPFCFRIFAQDWGIIMGNFETSYVYAQSLKLVNLTIEA
jgi:hypothetical protein